MSFIPTGRSHGSGVSISGLKEAPAGLREYFDKIFGDIAAKNFHELGEETVNEMQSNAPVITGFLRDNIQITSEDDKEITIESQADYSGFVEFGTIYQRAQPFFSPPVNTFGKSFLASFGADAEYQWRLIAGKYSRSGFAGLKAI